MQDLSERGEENRILFPPPNIYNMPVFWCVSLIFNYSTSIAASGSISREWTRFISQRGRALLTVADASLACR